MTAIVLTILQIALGLTQATAPASFASEYARLKSGRSYSGTVPKGALKKQHGRFQYWLVIPADYDPAKR